MVLRRGDVTPLVLASSERVLASSESADLAPLTVGLPWLNEVSEFLASLRLRSVYVHRLRLTSAQWQLTRLMYQVEDRVDIGLSPLVPNVSRSPRILHGQLDPIQTLSVLPLRDLLVAIWVVRLAMECMYHA